MAKKKVEMVKDLAAANRAQARMVRTRLAKSGILAVNLIGSPGCGKTTLLEATLPRLEGLRAAVIEGDIATTRDADRIRALGIASVQINTGGTCHLLATQVAGALERLDLAGTDLLFIENVGNLVCPSTTDLGEDFKVAVMSVPEGDDKAAKYPRLFREAACVVLNKTDLLGVVKFSVAQVRQDLERIKADLPFMALSAATGEGMETWLEWLRARRKEKRPCGG